LMGRAMAHRGFCTVAWASRPCAANAWARRPCH
jgi:hypothetical protein